jgi:predicted RNase H-like HicB family nuclease
LKILNLLAEIEQEMREAIEFHFEGMQLNGEAIPKPSSLCQYVEVPEVA